MNFKNFQPGIRGGPGLHGLQRSGILDEKVNVAMGVAQCGVDQHAAMMFA